MLFKKYSKTKRVYFKRKKKFNSIKHFFKFGDKGLFSFLQLRIEKIHLKIIRRIVRKKKRKKKKKMMIHNKYWVRYSQNLFLTKKSKNARMGSGRGKYLRAAFVLKPRQSFIEFKNFDYNFIHFLKNKIFYKLNIFLFVLIKKFKFLKIS